MRSLDEKLEAVEKRFEEVTAELAKPGVVSDPSAMRRLAKLRSELEPLVEPHRQLRLTRSQLEETRSMLREASEDELRALAQEEIDRLAADEERLSQELRLKLLPKDPNDERNVVLEIRAGTGGEEASLFAAELFRMYSRHAEAQRWRIEGHPDRPGRPYHPPAHWPRRGVPGREIPAQEQGQGAEDPARPPARTRAG